MSKTDDIERLPASAGSGVADTPVTEAFSRTADWHSALPGLGYAASPELLRADREYCERMLPRVPPEKMVRIAWMIYFLIHEEIVNAKVCRQGREKKL